MESEPHDLTTPLDTRYNPEFSGVDCLQDAKTVISTLRNEGRNGIIFYVQDPIIDNNCTTGHYWVVPLPANPDEYALNNTQVDGKALYHPITNREVLKRGIKYDY